LKKLKEMQEKLAKAGTGGGIDISALSSYMKKSDMDDLLKRLEKVEKKAKKAKDVSKKNHKKISKWKPKWK